MTSIIVNTQRIGRVHWADDYAEILTSFATDACALRPVENMNRNFEIFAINWHDGQVQEITKAQKSNELAIGKISFAWHIRRSDKAL